MRASFKHTHLLQKLIVMLLCIVACNTLSAQGTIIMPGIEEDPITHNLTSGESVTILDPGGTGNYGNRLDSKLTLIAPPNHIICIQGTYNTLSSDHLRIYDGLDNNAAQLKDCYGSGSINVKSTGNNAYFHFQSTDHSNGAPGYTITAHAAPVEIINLTSSNPDTNSVTVDWSDNSGATSWTVYYTTNQNNFNASTPHITTTSHPVRITGLNPGAHYYFRVCNNSNTTGPTDCQIQTGDFTTQAIDPCHGRHPQEYNVHFVNITPHSATLTWSDSSSATQWRLCWKPTYSNQPYQCTTVTAPPVIIEGLDENTNYTFRLNNNAESADTNDNCVTLYLPVYIPCHNSISTPVLSSLDFVGDTATPVITWTDTSNATEWYVRIYNANMNLIRSDTLTECRDTLPQSVIGNVFVVKIKNNSYVTSDDCAVQASIYVACPESTISGISSSNITYHSAHISWTDNSRPTPTRWYVHLFYNGILHHSDTTRNSECNISLPYHDTYYTVRVTNNTGSQIIECAPQHQFYAPCKPPETFNNTVFQVTANTATLTWLDTSRATHWDVRYWIHEQTRNGVVEGPHQILTTSRRSITLSGLEEHTGYQFLINRQGSTDTVGCSAIVGNFQTLCNDDAPACINFADIDDGCWVIATSGSYWNPDIDTGVIDDGYLDKFSRHTVNHYNYTDTRTINPETHTGLNIIPPGEIASVRLGNWDIGGEAESLTYRCRVDTLSTDLLILRYAAVLQNPSHTHDRQPRFTLKLLDNNNHVIDSTCYLQDFVSNAALGWNYGADSTILWKDWTTVGVDLSSLHGQDISIKLTSYDCADSGHYGYCYFSLTCGNKTISSENCGASIENTFTAPDGFSYKWYNQQQPDSVLSTSSTLHVTNHGVYICRLAFLGSDCYFEMSADAEFRYPKSIFTNSLLDTAGCLLRYQFLNNSVICTDAALEHPTTQPCEGWHWDFGDGTSSSERNPIHQFTTGTYTIRLIATLSNGQCADTSYQTISILSPCQEYDTITDGMCHGGTYTFFDSVITEIGMYTHTEGLVTTTLILFYWPDNQETVDEYIIENQLPWTFHGVTLTDTATDVIVHTQTVHGCDSTIHYNLHVWWNTYGTDYTLVCNNQFPYTWQCAVFTQPDTMECLLPGAGAHGVDSTVALILDTLPNTYSTVYDTCFDVQLPWHYLNEVFEDSTQHARVVTLGVSGCDSIIDYNLAVRLTLWSTCNEELFFPNMVTANGDGINDRFVIVGLDENSCYTHSSLYIFTRDGQRIFHVVNAKHYESFWDPNATNSPAGTYYYIFQAFGYREKMEHKGVIEVLR